MRWLFWACICSAVACSSPPISVATFNIENFPRQPSQIEGAMAAIRESGARIAAVQEIVRPDVLQLAAKRWLGPDWRFVTHEAKGTMHRVGLLYDSAAFSMDYARAHDGVRVVRGGRPALEVRLEDLRGVPLTVFVVHLKAGSEHGGIRDTQLRHLEKLVKMSSADPRFVLGDFNTTTPHDRDSLGAFAAGTGLAWASAHLRCTAYREGRGNCSSAALDHILTDAVVDIDLGGPCGEVGCWPSGRCPTFVGEVSDHCPVVATYRR